MKSHNSSRLLAFGVSSVILSIGIVISIPYVLLAIKPQLTKSFPYSWGYYYGLVQGAFWVIAVILLLFGAALVIRGLELYTPKQIYAVCNIRCNGIDKKPLIVGPFDSHSEFVSWRSRVKNAKLRFVNLGKYATLGVTELIISASKSNKLKSTDLSKVITPTPDPPEFLDLVIENRYFQ